MLRFKCPKCAKALVLKEELAGKRVACPACKTPFTAPTPKVKAVIGGDGASATNGPPMGVLAGAPTKPAAAKVSVPCNNCQVRLKIPLDLAGKQVPCPRCKKPVTIPALAELQALAAGAAAGMDVEDLALSALSGPETKAEAEAPKEQKKITVTCDWCDEKVQFDADLAGKQAPCPECKRIIKVPVPKQDKPKDWRDVQKRGPSLAVGSQTPALEGAWGTQTDRGVLHNKSMVEAGVVAEAELDTTRPIVWIRRVLIGLVVVGFLALVFWTARNAQFAGQETDALARAQEGYDAVKLKMPRGWAALYHTGAAEFLGRKDEEGSAKEALESCKAARAQYIASQKQKPLALEDDLLLIDLALALVELGGEEEQIIYKKKVSWDTVKADLDRTLGMIHSLDAKLLAARLVTLKLLERDKGGLALGLATQLAQAGDGEKEEIKPSYQANQVAMLVAVGKKDDAKKLIEPPDLAKTPSVGKGTRLAYVQAQAYDGNFEAARQIAQMKGEGQTQALLAIAEIALAKKNTDAARASLDDAKKIIADDVSANKKYAPPSLLLYQLVALSARLGATEDVDTWLKQIHDPGCKARAQLEILKAQAAKSGQPLDPTSLDSKTVAHAQAVLAQTRQKTKLGYDLKDAAANEDEMLRPLIYLGIALGAQDLHLGK